MASMFPHQDFYTLVLLTQLLSLQKQTVFSGDVSIIHLPEFPSKFHPFYQVSYHQATNLHHRVLNLDSRVFRAVVASSTSVFPKSQEKKQMTND